MIATLRRKIVALLLWSQRYTRADMLYIARGGFWVLISQGVNSTLSLALIVAFANLVPKETYGTYTYILSIAGVLNIFTLTGMNAAVVRATAKGASGVLRATVLYQLKWNVLMLVTFFVISGYYFARGDTVLATAFSILGLFIPATLAFNTYGAFLEGKKEFKIVNISRMVSTIVYVGGMLTAILWSGEVAWLIATYAVTTFVSVLFFYVRTVRAYKEDSATGVSETLKYGRELTYIQFIDPIASQIDKIILGHFWGPVQLATYSLALAVPNKASSLMKSWVSIGLPKFAEKTPKNINTVFYKRLFQGMLLGTLVAIVYVLLSPYLFRYVLPQYLESIFYSQLLAVSFIFALPNRYMSLLFSSQKLSRLILNRSLTMSVTNVLLYTLFGIFGGILGLVLANVLSSVVGLLLNITLWRKVSVAAEMS